MGLETIREMASFSFSRMWPRKSVRMEQLPAEEYESMLIILREYYQDYTLFVPDPLFKNGDYYVIRDGDRVVAGVQYYPVTWRIIDFGSATANWLVKMFTRLPWYRRRYNPESMKLLAFDGIYCEKGYEKTLYELLEGLLAKTGTYLAMVMADTGSGLYVIFKETKRLGILHRVMGTFKADIRVRFINLPDEVREYFLTHPTYIPTYDNS
jgi:hypothetical protein